MNFRDWLHSESVVHKLAIFDFDSTLADTPLQPPGWKATAYVAPDGKKRNGDDWWTHPDSLGNDYQLNPQITQAFQKAKSDANTHAVMLTGRTGMRTAHLIRAKLRQNGLYGKRIISPLHQKAIDRHQQWPEGDDHPQDSHDEFYKGDMDKEPDYPKTVNGKPDSDTFAHKSYVIEKKLMTPDIAEVEFWDDRESHLQNFIALFQRMLNEWPNLQRVTIYHVTPQGIKTIPLSK